MGVKDLEKHPGITIHRIGVGGGIMAALFALGTSVIFLLGVPASRWFLLASSLVGVGVAGVLYAWHKTHPVKYIHLYEQPGPDWKSE